MPANWIILISFQRKTIYIDLRNSNAPQQAKDEQPSTNQINPSSKPIQSSDSESEEDDNHNDGMLWFEKRQQARKQLLSQQPNWYVFLFL